MNRELNSKSKRKYRSAAGFAGLLFILPALFFMFLMTPAVLNAAEEAVVPGDTFKLSTYTDFFYNYPSEDFFYHLNDRLLFMDRPDGTPAPRGLRSRLLTIARWHKIVRRSLQRAKKGQEKWNIITLDVNDDAQYRKASVIMSLLGLQLSKTLEGKFNVAHKTGGNTTSYYSFLGLQIPTLKNVLNKTHHFHVKVKETKVPVPFDYQFLSKVTGLEINEGNFFETMLKNEEFSLLLGTLYRLSDREIDYISNLVDTPELGAWKLIYQEKKFLMGMFFLANALRVDKDNFWELPGGPAAAEFWNQLSGKDYRKTPVAFLKSIATKNSGKLNYLFLFARFLSPKVQETLFTGANAQKMIEIYPRIALKNKEKLNAIQFPKLRDFSFFTLLYTLRMQNERFDFPLGADSWLRMLESETLEVFQDIMSGLPGGTGAGFGAGLAQREITLKSGEKIKGSIQVVDGKQVVIAKSMAIDKNNIQSINPPLAEPKPAPKKAAAPKPELDEEVRSYPKEVLSEDNAGSAAGAGDELAVLDQLSDDSPIDLDNLEKQEAQRQKEVLDVSTRSKDMFTKKSLMRRLVGRFFPSRCFGAKVNYNIFQPASKVYRELYGNSFTTPELKLSFNFAEKLQVWVRTSGISGSADIPLLSQEATSSQTFFSFGLGYESKLSKRFSLNFDLGFASVSYKEEAMGEVMDESATGFRFDGSISFHITKLIFTDITGFYLSASGSARNGADVKLGGFGGGLGLGIRF